MRKVLISILLASAAASPALADPTNWSDRQAAREERSQAKEDRQAARDTARAERPAAQAEQRPQFTPRSESSARQAPQFTPAPQGFARQGYQQSYGQQAPRPSVDERRAIANQVRDERLQERQQRIEQRQPGARVVDNPYGGDRGGNLRQPVRPVPQVMHRPTPMISDTPRPGTQPPPRVDSYHHSPAVQWNTSWRNNPRYDWQDYRRHHRSRFHIGFYYDPFGWGYSPFQIGWRMWPSYYSQRYWLSDPGYYGLPYAPPGMVWVRYWNDALLVDTWSGEVVDMIPNFFW
jgi:hypothetical protein